MTEIDHTEKIEHTEAYERDMICLYEHMYESEQKKGESLHQSGSSLMASSVCLAGLLLVGIAVLTCFMSLTVLDRCFLIVGCGTVFAGILMTMLAQWHGRRDMSAKIDAVMIQENEVPDSFQSTEQRLAYYRNHLYQEILGSTKINDMWSLRLKSSFIVCLTALGILFLTLGLILFGI